MFSRGETRISLSLSLFLENENRGTRNAWTSSGWSVAKTTRLIISRAFLFSWKITERERETVRARAGKIDTLPAIVCQQRERKKKKKSFLLFLRRGKRLLFLLSLLPSISFLWITRPVGVQSVTDCSPVEKGEREDRQGGDELHLE